VSAFGAFAQRSPPTGVGDFDYHFCRSNVRRRFAGTTVNYLIDHVAKSNGTFIRNGASHTPAEAVEHIKAKYEHFKNQIKTPEDFIRLSASKSLLTGKPYLMRTPDGKEMRLDVWLTEALKQYRTENHQ
jgi:hypothetical protein